MTTQWVEGPFYDRGDGSIGYVSYSKQHPGVARVQVRFYAGNRGPDRTYFLDERDLSHSWTRPGAHSYATVQAAARAVNRC